MREQMSGRNLLKRLLFICLAGYLLVTYVVQRVDVYGDSMEPVLSAGDVLLVDKLTPRFAELERFDLVVFRYRYRENQYYIKGIIGNNRETIKISNS